MALFQATNITPSLFAGEGNGTVAANDPVVISWQINGTDAMTGFRILISKNDTASTEVHGVTATDGCPAYGTNANGEQQIFTYAPTDSSGKPVKWSDWGLTDGAEYKMNITIYWGTVQSTPFVNLYSPAVFRTRTAPSLAIAVPVTVDKAYTTISGGYGQAQGDAISWVRWQLYLGVSIIGGYTPAKLLDDTGEMTTGRLQYAINGLISGNTYFVKCTVQTESGVQVSQLSKFTVNYNMAAGDGTMTAKCLSNGANLLQWEQDIVDIEGSAPPDFSGLENGYSIKDGKLSLDFSYVMWNVANGKPFSEYAIVNNGCCILWKFDYSAPLNPPARSYAPELEIQYNIGTFDEKLPRVTHINFAAGKENTIEAYYCRKSDEKLLAPPDASVAIAPPDGTKSLLIGITYNNATGIAPGAVLFWHCLDASGSKISDDFTVLSEDTSEFPYQIRGVFLSGTQTCDYLYIEDVGNRNPAAAIATPTFVYPTTKLYANFAEGLQAGNASANLHNAIYRQDAENAGLKKALYEVPAKYNEIRDFGVRSGETYTYEAYRLSADGETFEAPLSSPPITHNIDSYILMEATEDANYRNVWHVRDVWNFAYNIQHSEISNNNTPNMMANFTPYRRRQPSTIHGKSGTLQALIGDMDFGEYGDTWQRMEKLFAISSGAKTFFLKDAKGNLYMVGISAPVTQTIAIGNERKQVMASISWEETGDASEAVLIQTPDDEGWANSNMISRVKADVNMTSGQLAFSYPADYKGTTFNIGSSDEVLGIPLPVTIDGVLKATTPDDVSPTICSINNDNGTLAAWEAVNNDKQI